MKKLNNCPNKWDCLLGNRIEFVNHFIHYMVNVKPDSVDWIEQLRPCLTCEIIQGVKRTKEKNGKNGRL